MASLSDIGVAAAFNVVTALLFLLAFVILRVQPMFDMVYFPKWYLKGVRSSPTLSGVKKFVNLEVRAYLRILEWVPAALKMPEPELIEHAGLDSAVYLRIYLIGLKIFVPIAILAFAILVPVNWTNKTLEDSKLVFSNIDKLSISNIPSASNRFWTHLVMAYVFTFWTCYVLLKEYAIVASMRLHFLESEKSRPDQFTVLVRNVPPDPDESVSELVEHFFLVNHPDHYLIQQVVYNANKLQKVVNKKKSMRNWLAYYELRYERKPSKRPTKKTGFLGLWGEKVDAIEYYTREIEKLSEEEALLREQTKGNPKCIMPAAFVSFKTRWGAAVCAQTQQCRNPTIWLTDWAPEPRDIYWENLAIPFVSLTIRRLIVAVAFFFLTFFFMIPVALVQSIANLEGIERRASFLKPLTEIFPGNTTFGSMAVLKLLCYLVDQGIQDPRTNLVIEVVTAKKKARLYFRGFIKSFIQGLLPGIALKIFLILLPTILMLMSKFEGLISISSLERRSASKYYLFLLVNVFFGSIIAGTAFEQLDTFIHQSANEIPRTIGASIPMKATFFISYIMVDGWTGVAGEIARIKPLIIFKLKDMFLVKTEKDREEAMDPGSIGFNTSEPQIQLYFLLGLVYAVVTPFLLPFIIVFFVLAYVVYRHQIINVYNQEYESAAAFWPGVHQRIITALIISQLLLMGLLSTKGAAESTPLLIVLPVLTIWFHWFCKNRYEPAFKKYPLQEAMRKDTRQRIKEPHLDLKGYLSSAYVHPVFKNEEEDDLSVGEVQEPETVLVATKRQSRRNTPVPSKIDGSSSPSLPDAVQEQLL